MRIGYWQTLIGTGLAVAVVGVALAQQPPVRVRGEIEKVDGNTLTVKARDGAMLTVNVPDNVRVMNFVKASLADIKPNSYIGVTAMPQPDGSQKAIAIHIFLEAQRGTGEGHRPWDLRPGSTMTNAAVETTAGSVDGQVLTVKYKQGDKTDEKKVIVPPDARDRHLCAGRQERTESRRADHHLRRAEAGRRHLAGAGGQCRQGRHAADVSLIPPRNPR